MQVNARHSDRVTLALPAQQSVHGSLAMRNFHLSVRRGRQNVNSLATIHFEFVGAGDGAMFGWWTCRAVARPRRSGGSATPRTAAPSRGCQTALLHHPPCEIHQADCEGLRARLSHSDGHQPRVQAPAAARSGRRRGLIPLRSVRAAAKCAPGRGPARPRRLDCLDA